MRCSAATRRYPRDRLIDVQPVCFTPHESTTPAGSTASRSWSKYENAYRIPNPGVH